METHTHTHRFSHTHTHRFSYHPRTTKPTGATGEYFQPFTHYLQSHYFHASPKHECCPPPKRTHTNTSSTCRIGLHSKAELLMYTMPMRDTVAGEALSMLWGSKRILQFGAMGMRSPLARVSILLSSSTEFRFSIQMASTGPSMTSQTNSPVKNACIYYLDVKPSASTKTARQKLPRFCHDHFWWCRSRLLSVFQRCLSLSQLFVNSYTNNKERYADAMQPPSI